MCGHPADSKNVGGAGEGAKGPLCCLHYLPTWILAKHWKIISILVRLAQVLERTLMRQLAISDVCGTLWGSVHSYWLTLFLTNWPSLKMAKINFQVLEGGCNKELYFQWEPTFEFSEAHFIFCLLLSFAQFISTSWRKWNKRGAEETCLCQNSSGKGFCWQVFIAAGL